MQQVPLDPARSNPRALTMRASAGPSGGRSLLRRALGVAVIVGGSVGAALAPAVVQAQAVLIDEGEFRQFSGDAEIGTETFTIHRIGLGADVEFLATGSVRIDGLEMRPALKTAADQLPDSYQNTLSGSQQLQLSIVRSGPRYESRTTSAAGETQREYRAGAGTALLEARVAHQFYFVARGLTDPGTRRLVIRPVDARQSMLEFTGRSRESVRLGREVIPATRHDFTLDGVPWRLWVDDEGRVLSVEAADGSWRAERVPVR